MHIAYLVFNQWGEHKKNPIFNRFLKFKSYQKHEASIWIIRFSCTKYDMLNLKCQVFDFIFKLDWDNANDWGFEKWSCFIVVIVVVANWMKGAKSEK